MAVRKLMTAFAVEKEKLLAAKLPLITILAFTLVLSLIHI